MTAAPPSPSVALESFLACFHRLKPVTASFAGITEGDAGLPDFSPEGLRAAREDMSGLRRVLADAGLGVLVPQDLATPDWDAIDGALADAMLEVQLAEDDSTHFVRGNPSLAIGEAIFSLVALASREAAPIEPRVEAAIARLTAFPGFLHGARRTLGEGDMPAAWRDRAVRDCDAGVDLLADLAAWPVSEQAPVTLCRAFQDAATHASAALDWYRAYVASRPDAPQARYAAGGGLLDLTLRRGYWCDRPLEQLRHEARAALEREQARLTDLLANNETTWEAVAARVNTPMVHDGDVLEACRTAWAEARALGDAQVTWPPEPIAFVPLAPWARRAARGLSWRLYRTPPPLAPSWIDRYPIPVPDENDEASTRDAFARLWSQLSIRLLHAVYHGGMGRHVQYWHAARSPSRIGRLAAVDGAARMAMHSGGTLAEGWASYATEIAEELGYMSPDEQIAAERERVHIMVRAVVDLDLHVGFLTFEDAVRFHRDAARVSEGAARAEVTRCSMFPGTGVMRWLGLRGIWQARHDREVAEGHGFDVRRFHDAILSAGSIPVPLVTRLLAAGQGR